MYGKIFDTIYKGTLYGHWEAIVTFQQMIVLCNQDGVIDMTPQAIAATTSIPLEIIQKGIDILQNPDPHSRTPDDEGRRIALIDNHRPWGWYIVNHAKYKRMVTAEEKREADRQRIAAKREAEKTNKINNVAGCRKVSQDVANVAHTDTDTDTDINNKTLADSVNADQRSDVPKTETPPCPHSEIVSLYHEILPELRSIREWNDKRRRTLATRWKENKDRQNVEWWRKYFEYVRSCPFLMKPDNKWIDLEWLINPGNMTKVIEGKYEAAA